MSKINILPQNLVNKIAAGEVVERPASVVKELMENSLDAGAMRIDVNIEDGGKKLIQIQDDGIGMDSEDLARCVMPHATSKLANEDDLFNISTMGFRGEAVASIGSISQMEIISRPEDAIEAAKITDFGGDINGPDPAPGPQGTTFTIRNLFFNTPARRKFLRTSNTEINHISEQFTRIALANESVHFTLTHNGRKLKDLPGGQGLRERIGALFSGDLAADLIPIAREDHGVSISGLIGRPQQARSGSQWQYVFVNGRFVRDKFVSHAIREGYRSLMEVNRQPVVFLFINVAPDQIDVNVHPTKIEVRFANSNSVHSQVLAAIRDKLLGGGMTVDVKAESISKPVQKDEEQVAVSKVDSSQQSSTSDAENTRVDDTRKALLDFFKNKPAQAQPQQQMNFSGSHNTESSQYTQSSVTKPQPLYKDNTRQEYETVERSFVANTSQNDTGQTHYDEDDGCGFNLPVLQVHNSFIIEQDEHGVTIIDQHALHERVIYEQLNERFLSGNMPAQRLLIPETVDVTADQLAIIESNSDTLKELGIELEQFGPNTVAINSFPQLLDRANPSEIIVDMLDKLSENAGKLSREELLHSILDMMACKAAVKAGDPLTEDEIRELLAKRPIVNRSGNCPHGRPTTITITLNELRKMFKRT